MKPVTQYRGENKSARCYTPVNDKPRQRQPEDHKDGASLQGTRAGPRLSDDEYARRRAIAERYILHTRPGRLEEAAPQRTGERAPSSASSAAERAGNDLIADNDLPGPRIGGDKLEPIPSAEDIAIPELGITADERPELTKSQRRPAVAEPGGPSRIGKVIVWLATVASCAGLAVIGYGALQSTLQTSGIASTAEMLARDIFEAISLNVTEDPVEPASAVPAASTEPAPATATADPAPVATMGTAAPMFEAELTADSIGPAPAIDEPADEDLSSMDTQLNESDTATPTPAHIAQNTELTASSEATAVATELAPSGFEFAQTRLTVSEDSATATLVIRRTGSMGGEQSLSWWTTSDTAVADEDFASFGILTETFADGERNRAIHIPLVGDAIAEPTERFFVTLRYESMPNAQANARAELVVLDDD